VPRLPRRLAPGESVTLVEHLTELRNRLLIGLGAIAVAFAGTYWQRHWIIDRLRDPLPDGFELITLSPGERFVTSMTVAFYAAVAIALPILIWQIWAFLAPAFEEPSQAVVARLVAASAFLLVAGMAFAYFVALPNILDFLLTFDEEIYSNTEIRAREYFAFTSVMLLGFGVMFELPIFILGLVRLGILSSAKLRRNRRIGYGLCLIAVVFLPGVDFVSMALQSLPVVVLFEASIWISVWFERRWAKAGLLWDRGWDDDLASGKA
jgi:sec-independent protein translocase protein TatC